MSERLLGVLTAMRGRHAIAKAMLRSIPKELRGWRLFTVVVMDETDVDEMRPFLLELHLQGHLIAYAIAPNSPLTMKWQKGLEFLQAVRVDGICIHGSDDISCRKFWQNGVDRLAEAKAPIGVRSCWMLDTETGRMGRFTMGSPERPVGCGRFYPKSVLDEVKWVLWDIELERGLDGATEERLSKFGIKFDVIDIPGFIVDVKNHESMNTFDRFANFMGVGMSRFDQTVEREETERILAECGLDKIICPLIGAA